MIEAIVSWVSGIVFATLFATFLELLLPSSSMQKFVRVIMGLLIMLAILNPVIGFLERVPGKQDVTILAPRVKGAEAVQESAQAASRKRDQLVKEVYRRDLSKQMQALVMGVEGVAQASVAVECSDDQAGPMKIKQITVSVRPGRDRNSIKKIVISGSSSTPVLQQETVTMIRSRLSELYQLRPQQILVTPMER